jgi:hypothetical protein
VRTQEEVNKINRKILGIFVALMIVAMLATPIAVAKPPTSVSGEQMIIGYTPIGDDPKGNSDNHVSTAMLTVEWTGDIAGVAMYEGVLMMHGETVPINIHEKIHFDAVTVLGKSGSLTLQVSANLGRGGQNVFRWTIIDGTEELANLHGNGIYWLDEAPFYLYEGQVHFDP